MQTGKDVPQGRLGVLCALACAAFACAALHGAPPPDELMADWLRQDGGLPKGKTEAEYRKDCLALRAGTRLTLSGGVSGAGRLFVSGTGTVVLPTANDYAGGTTVEGVLEVRDAAALGTGPVTVTADGTLRFVNASPLTRRSIRASTCTSRRAQFSTWAGARLRYGTHPETASCATARSW